MTDGRRALPAIPLTATTTGSCQQQRQQQQQGATRSQRQSSTWFNDDGYYSDIHLDSGRGAARIRTWRRSFVDDPDHYDYPEFNRVTGNDSGVEQQWQRSTGGDQRLKPAELGLIHQPTPPQNYPGTGSDQPQWTSVPEGHAVPGEQSENDNQEILEQLQQPSTSAVYTQQQHHQGEVNRQDYELLDPSVLEELRRPRRPHSHDGIVTSSGRHSHLEVSGCPGTNNLGVPGTAARRYEGLDQSVVEEVGRPQRRHSYAGIVTSSPAGRCGLHGNVEVSTGREVSAGTNNTNDRGSAAGYYQGLDPADVAELKRRANIPQVYAGLTDGVSRERQGEVTESKGYEGLDPGEVEAIRQRARQPTEYAGLRDNVEDL